MTAFSNHQPPLTFVSGALLTLLQALSASHTIAILDMFLIQSKKLADVCSPTFGAASTCTPRGIQMAFAFIFLA